MTEEKKRPTLEEMSATVAAPAWQSRWKGWYCPNHPPSEHVANEAHRGACWSCCAGKPIAGAPEEKQAAVAMIEDDNDRVLCVWNKRYSGWSMPGGLREPGEIIGEALARELLEETGMEVASAVLVFEGEHGIETAHKRGRASRVFIFRVIARGEPEGKEDGCPIAWKTRKEFLAESPFAAFYERVFAKVPTRSALIIEDLNRARIDAAERANVAEHKLKSLQEQLATARAELTEERARTVAALKAWAALRDGIYQLNRNAALSPTLPTEDDS